jgi:hypothetical protein
MLSLIVGTVLFTLGIAVALTSVLFTLLLSDTAISPKWWQKGIIFILGATVFFGGGGGLVFLAKPFLQAFMQQ